MTVVDEKSRVPPLDEAAIARLPGALDRDGMVPASVIGSQARGSAAAAFWSVTPSTACAWRPAV